MRSSKFKGAPTPNSAKGPKTEGFASKNALRALTLGFAVEMTFCFVIMKDAEGGPTDRRRHDAGGAEETTAYM